MRLQPQQWSIRQIIDASVLRDEWEVKAVYKATLADMKHQLGVKVVEESAALFETKRVDLAGCPIQLELVMNTVPKQDTYNFESRIRRGEGRWLVRMLRRAGHQLFLWASYWERIL